MNKTILVLIGLSCAVITAAGCSSVPQPEHLGQNTSHIIIGRLGYPLGTYLTIEGTVIGEAKPGTRFTADAVNGNKLKSAIDIDVRNYKKLDLPEDKRCIIRGYETGKMQGVPSEVTRIEKLPLEQPVWQFYKYFIITSIVERKH